jgi:cytidine kinase
MPVKPDIVIVGSLALDDIATPNASRKNVLGGSVSFACAAASFFARGGMVAVAGSDFPRKHLATLRGRGIDLKGLQIARGRTFRWAGVYEKDFNSRRTLRTELNVFQTFRPELPAHYRKSPFVFLANIAPALQAHVLEQVKSPRFVMADTMNLWISTTRAELLRLVRKIDLLLINDEEARQLTGDKILIHAARKILSWGPSCVIIKKGEHGSMLISKNDVLLLPAFPIPKIIDPTGAGDAFAGGFIGYLAMRRSTSGAAMRRAMIYGTITASFAVESFGLDRLAGVTRADINRRVASFMRMIRA